MLTTGNQHLQRCKIETIPAVQLEETVIERLKELSKDQGLVAHLAQTSSSELSAKRDHQKSLIAVKEQDRRRIEQKLDNLYEAIADTTERSTKDGLTDKAKELQANLEQTKANLEILKQQYERSKNVVDASSAFNYLRIFRENFDKQPVGLQAEILKDYIRRIIVMDDGVMVEVFGSKGTENLAVCRTGVLPVFKLVDPTKAGAISVLHPKTTLISSIKTDIKAIDPSVLRQKYSEEGCSTRQLAKLFSVSKSTILAALKREKVVTRSSHINHHANPKFGMKVVKGRLMVCASEQKIITLIKKLSKKEGLANHAIARRLTEMGILTQRRGKKWNRELIRSILNREKLSKYEKVKNRRVSK